MKKRQIIVLLMLLCCFILVTISSYAHTISQDLSNNFFRLHILANSDSSEDQELKLIIKKQLHLPKKIYHNFKKLQKKQLKKKDIHILSK